MFKRVRLYIIKKFLWLHGITYKNPNYFFKLLFRIVPLRIKVRFIVDKHKKKQRLNLGFKNNDLENISVLHVVSIILNKANKSQYKYLGSVKDVLNKGEAFKHLVGEDVSTFVALKTDKLLYLHLKCVLSDLKKLRPNIVIYLDMPGTYYKSLRYLRSIFPEATLVLRSHNAEPLHNYDKFKMTFNFKFLFSAVKAYISDRKILGIVDYIDCISRYDLEKYWERNCPDRFLGKLRYLPFCYFPKTNKSYFKTDSYIHKPNYSSPPSLTQFGSFGRKLNFLNTNFKTLNDSLKKSLYAHYGKCKIKVTGIAKPNEKNTEEPFTEYLGVVDDPNELLSQSDLLVDLSSVGYGFKTKYYDAVLSGSKILINEKDLIRFPIDLYPFLVLLMNDKSIFELSSLKKNELLEHANSLNSNNQKIVTNLLLELLPNN